MLAHCLLQIYIFYYVYISIKWNNIVINFDVLFVWRIFRAITIVRMVTFQFVVAEIFADVRIIKIDKFSVLDLIIIEC